MKSVVSISIFVLCITESCGNLLWMHTDEHLVEIVLNELPGTAGPAAQLDSVQNTTHLNVQSAETPRLDLDLTRKPLPSPAGSAELIATFSCMPSPYVLELSDTYGIVTVGTDSVLRKYCSSASSVTKPNDWNVVQGLAKSELEITLRDPYMVVNASYTSDGDIGVHSKSASLNDQCPAGTPSFKGMACVVAVVRFKGKLLGEVNISTFTTAGTMLNKTLSPMGVTIVQVPTSGTAYASVNYKEMVSGKFKGKAYSYIDHWATTSAALQR